MDTRTVKTTIGERLLTARTKKKLRRKDFVDILNQYENIPVNKSNSQDFISEQRLKKWESGENPISLEWIPLICDALSCDIGYLFGSYEEDDFSTHKTCEYTGLSPEAVKKLHQLSHWPNKKTVRQQIVSESSLNGQRLGDAEIDAKVEEEISMWPNGLGVTSKGYTVGAVSILSDLIESPKFLTFINAISYYLIYGGALPEDAYKSDQGGRLSEEAKTQVDAWANNAGFEILPRQEVFEMYIQKAGDVLRDIFQDLLEREKTGKEGKQHG